MNRRTLTVIRSDLTHTHTAAIYLQWRLIAVLLNLSANSRRIIIRMLCHVLQCSESPANLDTLDVIAAQQHRSGDADEDIDSLVKKVLRLDHK